MALEKEQKQKIVETYQQHKGDTGSPQVQIALMSDRIKYLTEHLKSNPKDYSTRRGLLKAVSKRKSLLLYLKTHATEEYYRLIEKLELK